MTISFPSGRDIHRLTRLRRRERIRRSKPDLVAADRSPDKNAAEEQKQEENQEGEN